MTNSTLNVLVTGVAGLLGSHLLDRLLKDGHSVVGIDNLSMGSITNIAHHLGNSNFRFLERDITQSEAFLSLKGQAFDCIVHLAAFKIPRYGKAIDTLRINYQGTDQILQFAASKGCKCVIASTSDVYGRSPDLPFREDGNCVLGTSTVARWAYAVSKLFDEHLAFAYQESFGIPVVALRFFGSYGPRQHLSWWSGPQSVFIDAVLARKPIPIHGNGRQTRSFTYVSDTVEGIYAAVVKNEANGEILNIGSTHEITILDLARTIHRLSGVSGEPNIIFVPYDSFNGKRYEDVLRRVPDVSRCQQVLGVTAQVGLEEGLLRTIEWQRGVTATRASA